MLAILKTEPDMEVPANAAIAPGAVNSPVCLLQSGAGTEPKTTAIETASTTLVVSPCRYPWDVPLGIITSVGTGTVTIQTSGEIQLNRGYAITSQFFGTPTIGERVYYDGVNGQYVCAHSHGALTDNIGLFPGSAAIGYVSGVTDTYVRIRIEPQPATAEYVAVQISNTLVRGDIVMIDADTGVANEWVAGQHYCDGVYTGYVFRKNTSGPYIGLVCVSGPTWIHPTYAQLYAINSATALANYSPHSARIGADYSIHITSSDGKTKNVPTAGFLRWEKWYYDTTTTGKLTVLLDVAPNPISTGILDPEEDKGLETFGTYSAPVEAQIGQPVYIRDDVGVQAHIAEKSARPLCCVYSGDPTLIEPAMTPIGIARSYNATSKQLTVQTRGTIIVPKTAVFGSPFKGARVNYGLNVKKGDNTGKYYMWNIGRDTNVLKYGTETTATVTYNTTPGAATIGFVQDYTDTTVTIRLDFRPPTATYRRMLYTGTQPELGTIGGIDVSASYQTKIWDKSLDVAGICVSSSPKFSSVVYCTRGPAWLRVKYKDLFSIETYSSMQTKYGTGIGVPYRFPVAASGAIALMNPDRLPIIGEMSVDTLYSLLASTDFDDDDYVSILIDVDILQGVKTPAGITIKYDSGTVQTEPEEDAKDLEDAGSCVP